MAGEQGAEGKANTKLFAELVTTVGWTQKGPLDQNVDCQRCKTRANGTAATHGVDGLFTFFCPFLQGERAVVVDGKRWSMDTMNGPAKLSGELRNVAEDCVHLRESPDALLRQRDIAATVQLDTAMLLWHCHEGWNEEKALRWLREASPGVYRVPPVMAFVSTNIVLDRLATICTFRARFAELDFYYPTQQGLAEWYSVLTPETLHSAMSLFRYREHNVSEWKYGAFYFDTSAPAGVRFLLKLMKATGFVAHPSVEVHVGCPESQVDAFREEIDVALRQVRGAGHAPEIRVLRLQRVGFDS
jgi:hypothetical protein